MQARLVFVSLLLGAALAAGCARNIEVATRASAGGTRGALRGRRGRHRSGRARAAVPRPLPPLAGKKPGGLGFVQNTPDTWGPFDVSVRTGFFDPDQMASPHDVRVCLEIDDVGFDVFYDVCATHNGSLWVVQGFRGAPFSAVAGTIQIDSDEIELRVEQRRANINFYARAPGDAWTPVSTTPFAAQTAPLKPSFGATGLSKGTSVGFDDLVFTSQRPAERAGAGGRRSGRRNAALLAGYAAYRQLEQPDFATADVNLGQAQDAIDDAQAAIAGLPAEPRGVERRQVREQGREDPRQGPGPGGGRGRREGDEDAREGRGLPRRGGPAAEPAAVHRLRFARARARPYPPEFVGGDRLRRVIEGGRCVSRGQRPRKSRLQVGSTTADDNYALAA